MGGGGGSALRSKRHKRFKGGNREGRVCVCGVDRLYRRRIDNDDLAPPATKHAGFFTGPGLRWPSAKHRGVFQRAGRADKTY